jgi:hypothetical protein
MPRINRNVFGRSHRCRRDPPLQQWTTSCFAERTADGSPTTRTGMDNRQLREPSATVSVKVVFLGDADLIVRGHLGPLVGLGTSGARAIERNS